MIILLILLIERAVVQCLRRFRSVDLAATGGSVQTVRRPPALGYGRAVPNPRSRVVQQDAALAKGTTLPNLDSAEQLIELGYGYHATPWLTLRPHRLHGIGDLKIRASEGLLRTGQSPQQAARSPQPPPVIGNYELPAGGDSQLQCPSARPESSVDVHTSALPDVGAMPADS